MAEMELEELLGNLRDIERYEASPIPEDATRRMVNALKRVQCLNGTMAWRIIMVREDERKRKIMSYCHGTKCLMEAPVVMVLIINVDEDTGTIAGYMPTYPVNAGIAMAYITLVAGNLGLGTHWITNFNEDKVADLLQVPQAYRIVGISPLGIPAEEGKPFSVGVQNKLVTYELYSD